MFYDSLILWFVGNSEIKYLFQLREENNAYFYSEKFHLATGKFVLAFSKLPFFFFFLSAGKVLLAD